MAKTNAPKPSSPSSGEELIVIVNSDAGIEAAGPSVRSMAGRPVSNINKLMKDSHVEMVPIFGPENRVHNIGTAALRSLEADNISPATYYIVNGAANPQALAEEFLNDPNVSGAYVKPPSSPPVFDVEQLEASPAGLPDFPPVTPNFITSQLYLETAPGGINAKYAWTLAGGKGTSIRIIDIEGAWRFTHEDLLVNQGGVIGGTPSADLGWRNHGTAVVGTFGGDDNPFGITGISPAANVRAIAIFGLGSAQAIRQAADALSPGDIILIELHAPGPRNNFAERQDQLGYIAMEFWPDNFAAIRYAVSRGVIVVEAAGNGAENYDTAIYNTRPAGFPATWSNPFNLANPQSCALIVGAGAPPPGTHGRDHGPNASRLGFSNYGARVDAQGWGQEVTTAGYGNLQGGAENFWYTDTFNGTSSASPVVVGALACIQGRLKAKAKPLLTPATAVSHLRSTGTPQTDAPGRPATQRIGRRPDLKASFTKLGIGGKVIIKDGKDGKEIKELKEVKEKDFKEIKEKELKELKEKEGKEFKEFKEFKEKDKDLVEGGGGILVPDANSESQATLETRVAQLEQALGQLSHFITSDLRPDLEASLFDQETEE